MKVIQKKIRSSPGFSLVELLVVVAILGILSAVGTLSYNGYVSGAQKKSAINIMKQIMLAQTEEYSNSSSYYINGCSTESLEDGSSSDEINGALFGGDDIIADDIRYEMCIESTTEEDGSSSFNVVAVKGDCTLTMPRQGELEESDEC